MTIDRRRQERTEVGRLRTFRWRIKPSLSGAEHLGSWRCYRTAREPLHEAAIYFDVAAA